MDTAPYRLRGELHISMSRYVVSFELLRSHNAARKVLKYTCAAEGLHLTPWYEWQEGEAQCHVRPAHFPERWSLIALCIIDHNNNKKLL